MEKWDNYSDKSLIDWISLKYVYNINNILE